MNRSGIALLLAALAAGVLGVLAGLWWQARPGHMPAVEAITAPDPPVPSGLRPAAPGDLLPALTLPDLEGNPVNLRSLAQGRPLLINVWASWCGPCVEEMPALDRFAAAQGAEGVQVLGLALDTPEGVRAFLQRTPVRYRLVLEQPGPSDASVRLGNRAGVLPYSVLVGADGRVLRQKTGPFAPDEIDGWAEAPVAAPAGIQTRD
ncbi:TlpA family protein disulfide reductase [Pseudoxanthomonas spadix]|uniref:TlpA family protein disulfide reductase n=1 Tax=Pseudoxanthomonas spadix TaxID=415229 RepID=UPI000F00C583|nr:TlpA disulfide reductase family protein [Pseudoxanthomonas spadix]MBP3974529.1 TlpA family protein disulfide reductase [Pseudoxanthomonas spadix]RMW97133.1 TlpA family protein disulfide reductase [Pseudoxanthomonas spadix]